MASGKALLPGEYQHCTTRPVLKSSRCREVASVGGKFQNTRFETPTVPGIRGSASGRIIFAVYTSTEGYSDSRIIKQTVSSSRKAKPAASGLVSFSLKCSACHGVCCHWLKCSLGPKRSLSHSLKVSQSKYYNLDFGSWKADVNYLATFVSGER